jgi:hypothetical protein
MDQESSTQLNGGRVNTQSLVSYNSLIISMITVFGPTYTAQISMQQQRQVIVMDLIPSMSTIRDAKLFNRTKVLRKR